MVVGNRTYKALGDPTRRAILKLLRERDMSAGEIASHFDLAKSTLSQHFAVLREADLVQDEKVGASVIYHLNVSVLEEAVLGLMEMFNINSGDDQQTGVEEEQWTEDSEQRRA